MPPSGSNATAARATTRRSSAPTAATASATTANQTFTTLRRQLGWTAAGRTQAPRVHDLRHRMVVRRIQTWHAEGVNVDSKISVLATYLGHVEVRDVYWYLSAVPELMSIIAARFEAFTDYPPPAGLS
jgi:integrase